MEENDRKPSRLEHTKKIMPVEKRQTNRAIKSLFQGVSDYTFDTVNQVEDLNLINKSGKLTEIVLMRPKKRTRLNK